MNEPRRWAWFILGTATMGVVVILIYVMLHGFSTTQQIRDTQVDGTPLGKKLLASAEQIENCTTPGRECYERSQRQTGKAIADINRITLYAAACADRPGEQSVEQIQNCVLTRLAADRTTP